MMASCKGKIEDEAMKLALQQVAKESICSMYQHMKHNMSKTEAIGLLHQYPVETILNWMTSHPRCLPGNGRGSFQAEHGPRMTIPFLGVLASMLGCWEVYDGIKLIKLASATTVENYLDKTFMCPILESHMKVLFLWQ